MIDWKRFEVTTLRGHRAAVPALCCFFLLDAHVHEVAGTLANGLERYLRLVGLGSLESYAARSGAWRPMSKRQLAKDLAHLRNFPEDHLACHISYDAGEGGQPGGFGMHLAANVHSDVFPDKAGLMRFDLPAQWLEEHAVQEVIAFVSDLCELAHVQSAQVGLTFKTTPGSHSDAKAEILRMLARYYGFSPCDFSLRNEMLNHTLTAHWLNFVNHERAATVGGVEAIVGALPRCEVRTLTTGVFIRGAEVPPIGDIDLQALDLGALPDIARLLAPTRVDITTTYLGREGALDARRWITRMDALDARAWNNAELLAQA